VAVDVLGVGFPECLPVPVQKLVAPSENDAVLGGMCQAFGAAEHEDGEGDEEGAEDPLLGGGECVLVDVGEKGHTTVAETMEGLAGGW
jgi:hypothetical protein